MTVAGSRHDHELWFHFGGRYANENTSGGIGAMKHQLKFTVLALLLGAGPSVQADDFDKDAAVQDAKKIAKALGGALQKELQAAMKAGGPVNALDACNVEAMPLTAQTSKDYGATVSRVSLKNRNPENAPDDWQQPILQAFDERAANGEDPASMASATVEPLDNGKQQLRFMKALPVGGVCLACHGAEIDAKTRAKIDELYPDDKATDYSLGEIRGAIVVVKDYE